MIPNEAVLVPELQTLKYKVANSNDTIRMDEKEEAKNQLDRSPDLANSRMLTLCRRGRR